MGSSFDKLAFLSSAIYFAILSALLVYILKSEMKEDLQNTLNIAMLVTLILPLMFFMKKFYYEYSSRSFPGSIMIDKYQTLVLIMYFILILVDTILQISKTDDQGYILYTKVFVLPILVLFSFHSVYQHIKNPDGPKHLLILSVVLALFYYIGLFGSALDLSNVDSKNLMYLQVIFTIFLSGVFMYTFWKSMGN
jgi:hypothetical protein